MSTAVILKQFGLVSGSVNYSKEANAFLSTGYTSAAGNTYFNAVRFAEGILIKEDVGQGYAHSFLNGLRIYSLKNKELLAEGNYNSLFYSKVVVRNKSINMLLRVLKDAASAEGVELDEGVACRQITKIIDAAMNTDQRELLGRHGRKYLS